MMKLAEALLVQSDAKKKLASLRERVASNSVVQQGEEPHEDPLQLIKEAAGVIESLERLTLQVNAANQTAKLSDGRSLAQVLARRDSLAQQHAVLQGFGRDQEGTGSLQHARDQVAGHDQREQPAKAIG